MTKSRQQVTVALVSVGVILAAILTISPRAAVVADEMSGDIYGIDILGITQSATNLPVQQFSAN